MTIQPMSSAAPGQPLMSIGNLHFTEQYVMTPAGTWPLAQTNVTTSDQTATTTHTPAWAVVLTIIFIWLFLLSLLFLLARQTRVSGYMAVHVQSGGYSYTEQVPVYSAAQKTDVFNRVLFVQSLIGRARGSYQG
jgi:hypothetical protein